MKGGPALVLETLRRAGGNTCSGQALSELQGVSRAQVWKHVQTLRARGYQIDAAPGEGYRLSQTPDLLYAEEILAGLDTDWLGREIHHFDEIDSTNRVALELARSGCAHGTTVVAESQSAGRGRLGRSFYSPPATNLYTSIVLRPAITTATAPTWILASAAAVATSIADWLAEFVDAAAADAVEIKWPNDVLISGLKTSGILMELGAEATRVDFLVLGIGINLNVEREDFPDEFRSRATSLFSCSGKRVSRVAFARRLYGNLERVFDLCGSRGFDAVRPEFESRFRMPGRRVTVCELDGSRLEGTAIGIDTDGALRLRRDGQTAGEEVRVIAGDVTLAKEST
jgi:BirA family biotin operon repressor/biotin-[acetyl-CoA-carboxylase] ligase